MKLLLVLFLMVILALSVDTEVFDIESIRTSEITVTIEGEVESPGQYTLPAYSHLQDLLELAVVKETADLSTVNPGMILKDRDIVILPAADRPAGRVSINTASREELCTLPGIGPATADKIIAYRETNGFFRTLDELMNVKGIGQKKYEQIIDQICL